MAVSGATERIKTARERGESALSEYASKRLLESYGVPAIAEVLAGSAREAVDAAGRLGYPVVVKACGAGLMHKTDLGLVALNLIDAASVESAVADLTRKLGPTPFEGFLVQPMLRGRREIIVGGLRDPLFGPCVMLGLGGILVETLADVTFRLAPLDQRDGLEMMRELRGRKIFQAVRGEPEADAHALSDILISVGRILMENADVAQIDINPVIFEGSKPVAVDALATLTQGGGR